MMTTLVTGGCGFIGCNLVPFLTEQGFKIRVLDNLSVGQAEALIDTRAELIVGDVLDERCVEEAMKDVDAVIHLAAHTSVVGSQRTPLHDFDVNARGTLNLLLAARRAGASRFVFASSNAPLGECAPPIREDKAPAPLSPYGASKMAGEGYCSAFYGSFDLNTVVLRFANVYGPRSGHKGSVVAKFLRDAARYGRLTVYGDGKQTRDFIHVHDLCRAILCGLRSEQGGEVYQVASGKETSINVLAQMIVERLPYPVEVLHLAARKGEIVKNFSDITKAHQQLDWTPIIPLDKGLDGTIAWFYTDVEGRYAEEIREG